MRNPKIFILLLVCFFSIHRGICGTPDAGLPFHGFNILHWDLKDGIPGNIQALAQTPDGYLWIGNESGITRFDGVNVSLFDRHSKKILTEDDCYSLFVSHDSLLYCGLYNGLVVRYRNGDFEKIGSREIFKDKSIISITEDKKGNIYFATDGAGVVEFDGRQFSVYTKDQGLPSDGIQTMCSGKEDEIWAGTDIGLACIRGGKITCFNERDGLKIRDISTLYYGAGNCLWIGGYEGELIVYKDGKFQALNGIKPGISSAITAIREDRDGDLWIGTAEEGIFYYDLSSLLIYRINTPLGLSSDLITALQTEKNGDLLAGTQGGGLNRLKRNLLKTYGRSDGLSDNQIMTLFCNDKGEVWTGSTGGKVSLYRNGTFTDLTSRFGLNGNTIFSICEGGDGRVWVAAQGSLVAYDEKGNKKIYPCHDKLPNTLFHAVYTARDGSVWAGTDAGIYIFRGDKISTLTLSDGLTDEKIFCFLEDSSGNMWIGTQEGGINIFKDGKINAVTRKEGLSDNLILCFYQDREGNMWVGTGHDGLNRIDAKDRKISQFAGQLNNTRVITYITEDHKGNLWLGSDVGILVVSKSGLETFNGDPSGSTHASLLGLSEGMAIAACTGGTFPSGCRMADGKIWFATEMGIVEADPANFLMAESDQSILIADLLLNNESKGSCSFFELSAGVNHIEIDYSAPGFTDPAGISFRYTLEGFDTGWIDAGTRRSAFYTKLSPGNYTFRAGVRDHNGNWSSREATLRIHVKPFFYQTWWFISGCLVLFMLVIYLLMKYRLREIREKELEILVAERTEEISKLNAELEQKVIDRTGQLLATNTELEAFSYSVSHDLRAPVRRIEGLIHALHEDYSDRLDQAGKDFLSKISESVANMSQLIEELLKLSRIARQDIERTEVNITGMVKDICTKLDSSSANKNVKWGVQENMVHDADPRLLQIAFQNLLDNCWKYTGKSPEPRVDVGLKTIDGKDTLFVKDNGVGFDMSHYEKLFTPFQRLHSDDQFTGTGIGLATVKRIILKHGGTIRAESETDKGTTFFFTLK